MLFDMVADISDDIPIIIDKNDEDATSFIETTYEDHKKQQHFMDNTDKIDHDTKLFIE